MKDLQLIIFDCDGVLVDSEPLLAQLLIDMLGEHGLHWTREEVFAKAVGRAMAVTIATAEAELGKSLPAAFADTFRSRARPLLAEKVQPVPGIGHLLDSLTLPYCVASGGRPDKIHTSLSATGLLPRFAGRIFSAAQVKAPKPAPDVFLLAAQTMGVAPAHCLVIEDSVAGVQAGVAAGMTVFGFAAHIPPERLTDAGAARVFTDMRDVQAAIAQMLQQP